MLIRPQSRYFLVGALAVVLGCASTPPAAPPAAPALPTSASVGGTSIVAIAPPGQACCPKQTLPEFLGLTALCGGVKGGVDRFRNHLGKIWPGLEAKPELLALTDPANLASPNPAVAEAAKVKAEEDAAAQKAKAIAYLATVGCSGCYPGVEKAILDALDDCTEVVRFAGVSALRSTAGEPCKNCRTSACCSQPVREKLEKLAYEQDANGCYVEPSDRVRRVARLALCSCSSVPLKTAPTKPLEGPPAGAAAAAETAPPTESLLAQGEELPSDAAPAQVSVLATRSQPEVAAASAVPAAPAVPQAAIGSGVEPSLTRPVSGLATSHSNLRPVAYEEVLDAYQQQLGPKSAEPIEVAWVHWTAGREQFASPHEAAAAMMIARTQALSRQGEVAVPQVRKFAYDWTAPEQAGSPEVARALATLPVGGVSGVIEDRRGLHLVRVVARRAAVPTAASQPAPAASSVVAGGGQATPATGGGVPAPSVLLRLPPCNCDN
ncbi:MAG: peptidylprolyl isomerase [Pirellulaceae bacterium]|jgi:hypothetical protein|nr:peptidylprolyl isomerase [Pirellulaceae bacterium]